jgi:hypothetical protein
VNNIKWRNRVLLLIGFFYFTAYLSLITNYSLLLEQGVSLDTIIFLESGTGIIKWTNILARFIIIEVDYGSLPIFKDKEVFLHRFPECVPYFIERYQSNVLLSFIFNNTYNLVKDIITYSCQVNLFFFN